MLVLEVVVCVVVCVVVLWKGEREGHGERFQAMTYIGGASMLWTALHLCAEPMSEAVENPSPVSSGVLVTVKLYVYANKGYSVCLFLANCMSRMSQRTATECPMPMPQFSD